VNTLRKLYKALSRLDTLQKKLECALVITGVLFLLAMTVPIARQILSIQTVHAANVKHWWCKQTGNGDWHVIPPDDHGGPHAAEFETDVLFVPGGDKPSDSICNSSSPTATPIVIVPSYTPTSVVVVPSATPIVVNPTSTSVIPTQPTGVIVASQTPSPSCTTSLCPCEDEWHAIETLMARQASALERIASAQETLAAKP
jgi:hypothetical protein